MERPVKDGILYVQHCKFGKRSWRKMRAQLFAASPSGVARMEKFDVRDDGTALEKTSLRRCARRVIRLGAKETTQSSAGTQPSPAVPMEDNSLYSSWQDLTERTDAATRCGLHGHYLLSALPQSLTLKDPQSRQPLLTWPYPFLRKFGQDQ
ncbi:PREDICTED: docking protein 3-like, partial [Chlamydotis macqueenii]|uniref:docking protein 3-like n=1 Tax=Chlamydotis macqueenii TaxID=187382 RepID=UPI000529899F